MFKRLFGGGGDGAGPSKPQAPAVAPRATTSTVDAIQRLQESEDLLSKRRDLLEKKIAAELNKAKEYQKKNNKKGALAALRQKKMYEGQLEQIDNSLARLGEQRAALENLSSQAEVINALKVGADASKGAMKAMKIDQVDQVLDDINEANDQMKQIQDALAMPTGLGAEMDEDDLLQELEDLEEEHIDELKHEAASVPATRIPQQALPELPSAPQTQAAPAKTPEELELEALEAEMAQ
jgi:vacuolar-type H+-ATPase subunit I/STV1